MRAVLLVGVAVGAAVATALLQSCSAICADCNCPPPAVFVVTEADDADLVGAEIQLQGFDLVVTYVKGGETWTVTYEPLPAGGSGS